MRLHGSRLAMLSVCFPRAEIVVLRSLGVEVSWPTVLLGHGPTSHCPVVPLPLAVDLSGNEKTAARWGIGTLWTTHE